MTAAAVLVKELIGNDFELHSVSRRDTPEPGAFFLEPLDVAVEYGADKNQARFAYQVLARTMPMANVITAAQCEQQCQDLMVRRRRCSGVATLVRHALTQAGEGRSALAGIASRLNMTERTLKRHLREEGTCFRHLLEEHLSHQACQLLGRPGTTVAGVAEQLGFSDASSFSQAFKRWTGDSPRGYQQARQRGLLA
jgi:AraC-like DNA-binding protein